MNSLTIPTRIRQYILEINSNTVILKQRRNIATIKLIRKFTKEVYAEFQREKRAWMRFFEKQKAFDKLYAYAKKEHPDLYEEKKIEKSERDDLKEINKYFKNWDDAVEPEVMGGVINENGIKAGNIGGQKAISDMGLDLRFVLKNPALLREIKRRALRLTKPKGKISLTTVSDLRNMFLKGYMEVGMDPGDMRKLIRSRFEETYKGRAKTIAHTETAIAQSTTQFETYEKNDIEKKTWLNLTDGKTRASHLMNRQTRPINKPFNVGGVAMMHPHDPAGGAKNVIRCRCDMIIPKPKKKDLPEEPWTGE